MKRRMSELLKHCRYLTSDGQIREPKPSFAGLDPLFNFQSIPMLSSGLTPIETHTAFFPFEILLLCQKQHFRFSHFSSPHFSVLSHLADHSAHEFLACPAPARPFHDRRTPYFSPQRRIISSRFTSPSTFTASIHFFTRSRRFLPPSKCIN
jgi:hypothetical protein